MVKIHDFIKDKKAMEANEKQALQKQLRNKNVTKRKARAAKKKTSV